MQFNRGLLNNFLILLCHSIPVKFSPVKFSRVICSFNSDFAGRVEIFNCLLNSISHGSLSLGKATFVNPIWGHCWCLVLITNMSVYNRRSYSSHSPRSSNINPTFWWCWITLCCSTLDAWYISSSSTLTFI